MNTDNFKEIYRNLQNCAEILQSEVENSFKEVTHSENFEDNVKFDAVKDHHCKEILEQLKEIKNRIEIIGYHEQELSLLGNKRWSKIDRDYIRKQIEAFEPSKGQGVHRRENRISRAENSSMKYLEDWEKFLEKQDEITANIPVEAQPVKKRENSLRKKKKVISSTLDGFLDQNFSTPSLIIVEEDEEEEEEEIDTKPRIVDVIYKNK